ncbi:putative Mg(2+) transport ATPase [Botrimarina colliarenosi]|uniref:Putative Mg(2+) transport ATPase n=1 Tax=Botrimarina colliarenosi TaxID=2528001 RepID=A0A5C6AIM1_9BACT|nr:MgtC/SapB family protein [Botrimarina colliarenosi]TWT99317.1 putative Mg(2+) transport ATPase [Botrimarina colliarenosi]
MLDADLPLWQDVLRLVAAAIGGAVVGIERESRDKPAGLRTHMLVSVGAAAVMLLSHDLCREAIAIAESAGGEIRFDPLRTVAGVIGGIGFLGAGSIFKSQGDVEGLTTAATIWMAGAIGLTCGAGRWNIAVTTVVLALVILSLIGWAERSVLKTKPRSD